MLAAVEATASGPGQSKRLLAPNPTPPASPTILARKRVAHADRPDLAGRLQNAS